MVKVRIILPGGGFKGLFQLGFLLKLFEMRKDLIDVDHVYGTSIGAILSPFVAAKRMDLAVNALESVENADDIFNSWSCFDNIPGFKTICKGCNVLLHGGLYKSLRMNLIVDELSKLSNEEKSCLKNVSVCSNRINDHSEVWHTTETKIGLIEGIELSARLPGALPPKIVDGEAYVDGGMTEMYPISTVWDFKTMDFKESESEFDGIYLLLDFAPVKREETEYNNIILYLIELLDMTTTHLVNSEIQRFVDHKNVYRYSMSETVFKSPLEFTPELKKSAMEEGFSKAQHFISTILDPKYVVNLLNI
jgi:hypothetical protein